MDHPSGDLKERSKSFAIRVVRVVRSLPSSAECRVIGNQLLRAATSVAANYRAVCRARSRPEFLAKLGIVIEETDEAAFWLEFLVDIGLIAESKLNDLISEANQLVAIFNASRVTAKKGSHSTINNQNSTISSRRA
ncbi:MAG TPA: four helix bundle protein [Candidatus Sulfotelmatobacter sp.]|nr:four helix bundle protein [Candidatus Sulfotelmatobacter sp.]